MINLNQCNSIIFNEIKVSISYYMLTNRKLVKRSNKKQIKKRMKLCCYNMRYWQVKV